MSESEPATLNEELQELERQLTLLKHAYEQYFQGSRPAEPGYERSALQKAFLRFNAQPVKNTAARFKFNTLNQRFQTFKRQWDSILRQIDAGTYKRHVFKAKLHERERAERSQKAAEQPAARRGGRGGDDLFQTYRDAAMACGQSVKWLTPEKLQAVVRKQEAALKAKLGCDRVNFRVVVESGKVKLKASAGG